MPILLGLAFSASGNQAMNWPAAGLTLLAGVLLHATVNVLNDYYDAFNGSDDLNRDRVYPFTGGSRFIQNGVLTRQQTLVYGLGLMLAVIMIGIYLVSQSGMALLVVSSVLPPLALISAVPAFLSVRAARILLRNAAQPRNLAPAIRMTILAMLGHGLLLTLVLAVVALTGR